MPNLHANLQICHRCGKWENHGGKVFCIASPAWTPIEDHARAGSCPLGLHADSITQTSTVKQVRDLLDSGRPFSADWQSWPNVQAAYQEALDDFCDSIEPCPSEQFTGEGVAIVGGGKHFPLAYLTLRTLRLSGCKLPVEIIVPPQSWKRWHRLAVEPWDARCVDLNDIIRHHPVRQRGGWPIKAYAYLFGSAFNRLIGLEAGTFVLTDPSHLLTNDALSQRGAILWNDIHAMVIDKRQAWKTLRLADWMCQRLDVREMDHGAKSSFQLAAQMAGLNYFSAPGECENQSGSATYRAWDSPEILFVHPREMKLAARQRSERCPAPEIERRFPQQVDKRFGEEINQFITDLQVFHRRHALRVHALTVSVNYGDYLAWSLPANQQHFDSLAVVTTDEDSTTLEVCRKHQADVVLSDRMESPAHHFDKGAAINDGLNALAAKAQGGWICLIDADMLLPANLRNVLDDLPLDPTCIYGIDRGLKSDKPISGFFQLFHSSLGRRYQENHPNAGSTDIWFRDLWPPERQLTITGLKARHLSRHGVNWSGRVSPPFVPPINE